MNTHPNVKGYELHERIGSGGFGIVHRAYQSTVGREVAVKIILPHYANQPDFIRRFETEAQLIARLEHMNIVPLYDYWRDPDGAYLVMRWLRGGNLKALLSKGPLDLTQIAKLLDQVASALSTAHRNGVIHRDIKPSNILLDEDGNAYLSDFGIAKDLSRFGDDTQHDAVVGSPGYLSPEQARSEPVSPRTDVYSLGVVLYEMLSGEHPFPETNPVERIYKHLNEPLPMLAANDQLDPAIVNLLNEIVQKATEKNPAQRYADALELAAAIREQALQQDVTPPESIVESLTRREQEILQLIIEGKSNREIADTLFITVSTVKWYINQLYKKLRVRNRVQAIVRARELNLVFGEMTDEESVSQMTFVTLPEPENPYKGLQAFQVADARDFFGREKITGKLVKRLQEKDKLSRFLAVVGPSGSGKSSLVKAGLIPALLRGDIDGSDRWFIIEMMPGARPLDELEIALTRVAADSDVHLNEHLTRDENGLLRVASLILPDDGSELVVVIDQFEEIFTLVEDEGQRTQFLDLIHAAVTDPRSRVRVVVTLRADFYDRPLQYPDFGELVRNRMETVLPLSADELERAINKPAEHVGVKFEDGLVASIIDEVLYQPGALPLLQYALTELFERRQERTLTHEAYQTIGGTVGALAKRADELYQEYNDEGQALIRQMFLRLVTLGEGTEDTRRRVQRSELLDVAVDNDLMDDAIDSFTAYRLLALDHDPTTREPTVEVAHEALLRQWERLRAWLNESRDDIKMQRQLAALTTEWEAHQKGVDFLVRGTRLDQFQVWTRETELTLTPTEQAFLDASLADRQRRETEAKARAEREASLEQRARRILQGLVAVFLIAAVVAGGLALWANGQRNEAEHARDSEAQARNEALRQASIGIAALAVLELDGTNPERGVLLAIEALEEYPYTPQAFSALIRSVDSFRPVKTLDARGTYGELFRTAAWSPDGTLIAGGGTASPMLVGIWDTLTGEEQIAFPILDELEESCSDEQLIDALVWSPTGQRLAAPVNDVDFNCGIVIWNTDEEISYSVFSGETGRVLSIDWSSDGNYLITAGRDTTVNIWNAQNGEKIMTLSGHTNEIFDVKFSPDNAYIASASADGTIRLWDTESGSELMRLDARFGDVRSIDWSPDSSQLVSGGSDGLSRVWDIQSGQISRVLPGHSDRVKSVAWSPNGSRIATQSVDGTVRIWDATTGSLFAEISNAAPSIYAVRGIAEFSPDSTHLMTGDSHLIGIIRVWDIESTTPVLVGHTRGGDYAGWSPDGRFIATSSLDDTIKIWNWPDGSIVADHQPPNCCRWGDWSPDSQRFVVGPTIFDAFSGDVLATIPIEENYQAITPNWSPDGSFIVVGTVNVGREQPTYIYNTETFEVVAELQTAPDDFCMEAWPDISPDSTSIATGCVFLEAGTNTPARIWDAQTGEELMAFRSEDGWSIRTVWSPDGSRMLVTYEENVAKIWNVEIGQVELTYSGHLGWVWSAAWSPDGKLIATSDMTTNLVKVWDSTTAEEILSISVPSVVNTIRWSPDGDYVILAGDGMNEPIIKRVWRSTEELIAHAYECCVTRKLTSEERQQFGLPQRD